MKKLFLSSLVLLMAIAAQAQTKVAPKLENGFKAVYVEEATMSRVGQNDIKITSETEYVVSDVTAKGAVITAKTIKSESNAAPDDLAGQLITMIQSSMDGVSTKLSVDADGKVIDILNLDEVKTRATELAGKLVDALLKNNPGIEQMMPKEALLEQITSSLDKEKLSNNFIQTGVLALNGKTLANGMQETINNAQGMKMKRMYFVTGKSIIANSTLAMSKDELKEMIIKQVEEQAPEQAKMIKENIDMVMGQMKFDASEKSTYVLGDNGWVKSIKTEMSQDILGQSVKSTAIVTLK